VQGDGAVEALIIDDEQVLWCQQALRRGRGRKGERHPAWIARRD
jgi:hypothetical protein